MENENIKSSEANEPTKTQIQAGNDVAATDYVEDLGPFEYQAKNTYRFLLYIGLLNIALGIYALILFSDQDLTISGWVMLVAGALYALCAIIYKTKKMAGILILPIIVIGLNIILGIIRLFTTGSIVSLIGIVVAIFLLQSLMAGYRAMSYIAEAE